MIASVGAVQDVDIARTETGHRWFTVLGLGMYRRYPSPTTIPPEGSLGKWR